jgi:hypothetical protein
MASSKGRKPLPALAFLLALSLLTGLVWWRVIHRSDSANASPSCTTSASPSATPTPQVSSVPAAANVVVNVLNSTQRAQLASQVSALLRKDGFLTGTPDNDRTARAPVTGTAEIRYGPVAAEAAKLLSFYVTGAVMVLDTSRTSTRVDLALGAKYTGLVAAADVKKALAAAHINQRAPSTAPKSSVAASSSSSAVTPSGSASSSC